MLFPSLAMPILLTLYQDLSQQLIECAGLKSDLARLACFDQLATPLTKDNLKDAKPGDESKWQVQISADPLTDSKIVILALLADGNNAMLLLRCKNAKAEVFINWNDYLGSEAVVTSRIGTASPSQQEWGLSTDKKATFYPRNSMELVEELTHADKFVAQVTPYNENPVTALFNVTGLAAAVAPFFESCKAK